MSLDEIWGLYENTENNTRTPKTLSCRVCGSVNIQICSEGHNACDDCSLINEHILDKTPEWSKNGNAYENNGRSGCPINHITPNASIGTSIKKSPNRGLGLMQTWGEMNYRERSLKNVTQKIEICCRKHNIKKSIIDNATMYCKNINNLKHESGENKGKYIIRRGGNRKNIIASCVFYGAMKQGEPRSSKEIGDIFNLTQSNVTSGCKNHNDLMEKDILTYNIQPSQSSDFIDRINSMLKIQPEYFLL